MKKLFQKKFLIPLFIMVLVLGYYLVLPAFIVVEKNEEIQFKTPDNSEFQDPKQKNIQSQPEILSQNDFQKAAYDVKGQALVMQQGQQRIIRFENFETINGPSLNIYLVNSQNIDIY